MTAAAAAPDSSASPYMANSSTGSDLHGQDPGQNGHNAEQPAQNSQGIETVGQPAAQRPGSRDTDHQ